MGFFNSKLGKEQLISHATGSTIKHINSESLSNIGVVFKTLHRLVSAFTCTTKPFN